MAVTLADAMRAMRHLGPSEALRQAFAEATGLTQAKVGIEANSDVAIVLSLKPGNSIDLANATVRTLNAFIQEKGLAGDGIAIVRGDLNNLSIGNLERGSPKDRVNQVVAELQLSREQMADLIVALGNDKGQLAEKISQAISMDSVRQSAVEAMKPIAAASSYDPTRVESGQLASQGGKQRSNTTGIA